MRESSVVDLHLPMPGQGKRDWKPLEDRSCTDVPWLILFTLFCIGMVSFFQFVSVGCWSTQPQCSVFRRIDQYSVDGQSFRECTLGIGRTFVCLFVFKNRIEVPTLPNKLIVDVRMYMRSKCIRTFQTLYIVSDRLQQYEL